MGFSQQGGGFQMPGGFRGTDNPGGLDYQGGGARGGPRGYPPQSIPMGGGGGPQSIPMGGWGGPQQAPPRGGYPDPRANGGAGMHYISGPQATNPSEPLGGPPDNYANWQRDMVAQRKSMFTPQQQPPQVNTATPQQPKGNVVGSVAQQGPPFGGFAPQPAPPQVNQGQQGGVVGSVAPQQTMFTPQQQPPQVNTATPQRPQWGRKLSQPPAAQWPRDAGFDGPRNPSL